MHDLIKSAKDDQVLLASSHDFVVNLYAHERTQSESKIGFYR
jgi:hypothetical protein